MHYLKNPTADTYISNYYNGAVDNETLSNFGANQTLAVDNTYVHNNVLENVKAIRRSLIQFDFSDINAIMPSSSLSGSKFFLKLQTSDIFDVPTTYAIYAYPISQSWQAGNGMYAYSGVSNSNGANWIYSNYPVTTSTWYPSIEISFVPTDDYLDYPSTSSFIRGGGVWYYQSPTTYSSSIFQITSGSSLLTTQSFSKKTSDVYLDVTTMCMCWICGVIPNYGMILMSSTELDTTAADNGELQFFSSDTNTIYPAVLDIAWDASIYLSASAYPSGSSYTGSWSYGSVTSSSFFSGSISSGSWLSGSVSTGSWPGSQSWEHITSGSFFSGSITSSSFYSASVYTGSWYSGSTYTGSWWTGSWYSGSWGTGSHATGTGSWNQGIWWTGSYNSGSWLSGSYSGSYYTITAPVTSSAGVYCTITNVKREYRPGSVIRFNVIARDLYPIMNFDRLETLYINTKYLPSSSYYSVLDNDTGDVIIPFDGYTKLSFDGSANYFMMNTLGFMPERFYKILIKVCLDDGSSQIYDNNCVFKITEQ